MLLEQGKQLNFRGPLPPGCYRKSKVVELVGNSHLMKKKDEISPEGMGAAANPTDEEMLDFLDSLKTMNRACRLRICPIRQIGQGIKECL